MTALKTKYAAVSQWMQKHHIRGIYLMIVLYVIVVALLNSSFLTVGNWVNLLRQVAVYGIVSCGITLIILTGRTDLSAGMMLTFLANISCYYVTPAVQNQVLAIVLPLLIGLVGGLLNGILVGVIRLNSFVSTLGMMSLYTGAVLLFTKKNTSLTGDASMTFYKALGQGSVLGIPVPVIILLVVAAICGIVLRKTVYGSHIYAVGSNMINARFSGINATGIIVSVYTISGLLTGLASVVMCSRIMSAQPKMGAGYEFTALTAVVLGGLSITGGKGNILGTLIGVLILGIIDNSFVILGLDTNLQYIVKGAILVIAVAIQIRSERRTGL